MITSRRRFLQRTTLSAAGAALMPHPFGTTRGADGPVAPPADDLRLQPLKDLDGYFPFTPPATPEAWARRAARVRLQLQVALGLYPLPIRHPLEPVLHGAIERENYRVEKVFFESHPGFFVTGSLYRPLQPNSKVPAVLFPHGHWDDARFMDRGLDATRREIAIGAERFEEGGRSIMQSMCVSLARLGCVVFHYDMLGHSDCLQISKELAHGFARQRPDMISPEIGRWGLFSPQAESNLQSVLGLQTWNSIRALDFLLELPEVDPNRVACTGASGGGTQTFLLAALDPRLALAFPAVMVSTAMQGGCTCENASLLRVGTGNVEIAALFAPKPMGMTSANDWTREMSSKGFPELKRLWTLLGKPDNVALFRGEHFEHNYNAVARTAFYGFLNRHFRLGLTEPVLEHDYQRLTREQLTVWDRDHPAPPSGPDFERRLLADLWADTAQQLEPASQDPQAFAALCRPAIEIVLGRTLDDAGDVSPRRDPVVSGAPVASQSGSLLNTTYHESVGFTLLQPRSPLQHTVLWLTDQGRAGVINGLTPNPGVPALLDAGARVCALDLLGQGASLTAQPDLARNRRVKNPREAAAYTYGYNRALFAQRVQDVLTALRFLRADAPPQCPLAGIALDPVTGPILAAALAVAGDAFHAAAVHTHGFRFLKVMDLLDPMFLPGGTKYGDLPGLLALSRVRHLWLAGETEFIGREIARLSAAQITRPNADSANASAAARWVLSLPRTA